MSASEAHVDETGASSVVQARGVVPGRPWATQLALGAAAACSLIELLLVEDAGFLPPYWRAVVGVPLAVGLVAVALLGPLALHWPRTAPVELRLSPGAVRAKHAWAIAPRTIRARDLVGVSTARLALDRFSLVLQVRGAPRPVTLELESLEAVKRVCRALGVGHFGFGYVEYALTPANTDAPMGVARIAALALALVTCLATASLASGVGLAVVFGACVFFFAWLVRANMGASDHARVALSAGGVSVARQREVYRLVPYDAIEGAAVETDEAGARGLRLRVRGERGAELIALPAAQSSLSGREATPAELEHVVAQIEGACARSRGEHESPPDHGAELATLERKPNESAQIYVARLDALAATLGRGGTYRSSTLTLEDLWAAVEDPDCGLDTRAGAARVLARVDVGPGTRARIEAQIATARADTAAMRFRAAMADAPEAAAVLLDEAAEAESHGMSAEAWRKLAREVPPPRR